jgi:hypothetical protein
MMLQGYRKADRAEVVEPDRFAPPKSFEITWGEKPIFPIEQSLCHSAKVVHAFEANTPLEKLPDTQITYRG